MPGRACAPLQPSRAANKRGIVAYETALGRNYLITGLSLSRSVFQLRKMLANRERSLAIERSLTLRVVGRIRRRRRRRVSKDEEVEANGRKSAFFRIDLGNLDLNLFFTVIHGSLRIQDRATVWPEIEQVQEAEWPATCDVCRSRAPLMLLKLHSITLSALGLT